MRKTQENVESKNTVVNKPIYLSITSNKVPNLTLIDLPGFTKVAVKGQSDEICKDIDDLVDEYIKNPNTIILAVSPANANIATSDALMLARKYDSEQSRTFGVITKIDIMDEGTNALKVLKGEEYELAHGFVGVKCRSQKDNINNKSISFALEEEKEFFRKHPIYKDISDSQGIGVLASKLSKLLTSHIRKCLPKIEELIKLNLEKEIDRLKELGPAINFNTNEEAFDFVTKIIEEYSESYSHFIQGKSEGLAGFKYACCTKIHEEFRYFGDTLIRSLNPLNEISIEVLLNEIRRSQGLDPCLFLPEEACRNVLIECIKKLMNPSKIC